MLVDDQFLIRLGLVCAVALFFLYQFGYYDRFPFIGKNSWRNRPFYREIYWLLEQQIYRFTSERQLPEHSILRLENTAEMVFTAFKNSHSSVQVRLPRFDCGERLIDFSYEITREQVLNLLPNDHRDENEG